MDIGHKILGLSLAAAILIIILMQQCRTMPKEKICPEIRDTVITEIILDTNWHDTTRIHWVSKSVPVPYFDTMYSPEILELIERGRQAFAEGEDFDQDFILKYPATYIDTVKFDTVEIYYNASISGYLNSINLGYRLRHPFAVTQIDIYNINTLDPPKDALKHKFSLYAGFDFESDIDSLFYFEPELSLIVKKWEFSGGISIPSKPIRYKAGIKRKIF